MHFGILAVDSGPLSLSLLFDTLSNAVTQTTGTIGQICDCLLAIEAGIAELK